MAVVALQKADGFLGLFSFQQFADGPEVAVTAADETEIVDFSVFETEADFVGTDVFR